MAILSYKRIVSWQCLITLPMTVGSIGSGCTSSTQSKSSQQSSSQLVGDGIVNCRSDKDCSLNEEICTLSVCSAGHCQRLPTPRAARCALDTTVAIRQADLFSSELNEYGVCYDAICMPRALCMQRCGEKLAKAIEPTVKQYPCADSRDCISQELDSDALARAESGLRECFTDCGFPTPEDLVRTPPKRVPDPRPPQPVEAQPESEPEEKHQPTPDDLLEEMMKEEHERLQRQDAGVVK